MDGSIVKTAIKASGKTQEEAAELAGIERETLVRMLKKDVPEAYVIKLRKAGIEIPDVIKSDIRVPYYDIDATAGNVTIFNEDGTEYIKDYIAVPAFQDCEMFINVSGSSMYPKYMSGELIALKRIKDFEVVSYGEAYLIVTDEQRLLKYIKKSKEKNMWLLCSEHEDYEPFDIHIKKIRFLYIVKGKITKNII